MARHGFEGDDIKRFMRYIKLSKENHDHFALAFAIEDARSIRKALLEWDRFCNSAVFRKRRAEAIDRFDKDIKETEASWSSVPKNVRREERDYLRIRKRNLAALKAGR